MKNLLTLLLLSISIIISFTSCSTPMPAQSPQRHITSGSDYTGSSVEVQNRSINEMSLDLIGDNSITFRIDIAAEDGAKLLKGLTLNEAKDQAAWMACEKYNCDVIFNLKYNYLVQDGRVLRITLRGRPANFKNQQKDNSSDNRHIEVNINAK